MDEPNRIMCIQVSVHLRERVILKLPCSDLEEIKPMRSVRMDIIVNWDNVSEVTLTGYTNPLIATVVALYRPRNYFKCVGTDPLSL